MAEKEVNGNNNPSEENTTSAPSEPRHRMWGEVEDAGGRKKTWPELVGVSAEEAERKVKEEMPRGRVQVVPADSFVTMDYRTDRVRLFIDSAGKVATPPHIG